MSQGLTYIEAMAADRKVVALAGDYTDQLLDDPALGTTFTTEAEMVHQVVNYLKHPNAYDDPKPRTEKLAAISADRFGDRVLDFYRDVISHYSPNEADETVPWTDESSSKRTMKG